MVDVIIIAVIAIAAFFIVRGQIRRLRKGQCGGCPGCCGSCGSCADTQMEKAKS